ncbi:MAG: hypothetical protein JXR13_15035 [Thalassovita sp.]
MIINVVSLAVALALVAQPASAGVVATAIAGLLGGGTIATALGTFVTRFVVGSALSALGRALQGRPQTQARGIRTGVTLTGETNPQSFVLGWYATGGTFVCPPLAHSVGGTPNDHLTFVIELGDIPGTSVTGLFVNGAPVSIGAGLHADYGNEIEGDYQDRLWIKIYDGSQTVADPMLLEKYSQDPDFPWSADMIGRNKPYVIITAKADPNFWTGLPSFRFEVMGIPLYDPRLDSSAGGAGEQRASDPESWAPSANIGLIVYNILRGIPLPNGDIWGGDASDLPVAIWAAGMNECDRLIDLADGGQEPQYRGGLEISVDDEPAKVIETFLAGCSGAVADVGGTWHFQVGASAMPSYFFTDDDIVVTDPQELNPWLGLENTTNAVSIKHPSPSAAWEFVEAPLMLNPEFEVEDGNRRLVKNLVLDAVPYGLQAQRLASAYVSDERRMRRHVLTLPPDAVGLGPLDTVSWTSQRNGYVGKQFELGKTEKSLVSLQSKTALREVDPSDYDWSPELEIPVPTTSILRTRPSPLVLPNFSVSAIIVAGDTGAGRRPGIQISWTQVVANSVSWQIRLAASQQVVSQGVSGALDETRAVITEGILPSTVYQVRALLSLSGQTDWTEWLSVTTGDVRLSLLDLDGEVAQTISAAQSAANAAANEAQQAIDDAESVQQQHDALVNGYSGDLTDLEVGHQLATQAATDAATARDAAQSALSAAEIAEQLALDHLSDAATHATAAASSASSASASDTSAGQRAEASEASRIASETAQANAQASEVAASSSETTALGHASTAATASGVSAQAAERAQLRAVKNLHNDPAGSNASLYGGSSGGSCSIVIHGQVGPVSVTAVRVVSDGDTSFGCYILELDFRAYPIDGKSFQISMMMRANSATDLTIRAQTLDEAGSSRDENRYADVTTSFQRLQFVHTIDQSINHNRLRYRFMNYAASAGDWFEFTDIEITEVTESEAAAAGASAAAVSAANAAASETGAGQDASAAAAARLGAETAEGNASASEASAAVSATDAAGSASSASSEAELSAAAMRHASETATGNLVRTPNGDNHVGGWLNASGTSSSIPSGAAPAGSRSLYLDDGAREYPMYAGDVKGRKIRASAWVRTDGITGAVGFCLRGVDLNDSADSKIFAGSAVTITSTDMGWSYHEAILEASESSKLWAPAFDRQNSDGEFRVWGVRFEDVTERLTAEADASAAATSAASAAASETAAGQSASAAQAAESAAQTARAGAESAESSAATSETNAAGSASSAASSATLAANSENAAGTSASSASVSEGNAAQSASDAAGAEASAASYSVLAARAASESAVRAQGNLIGNPALDEDVNTYWGGSSGTGPVIVTHGQSGTTNSKAIHVGDPADGTGGFYANPNVVGDASGRTFRLRGKVRGHSSITFRAGPRFKLNGSWVSGTSGQHYEFVSDTITEAFQPFDIKISVPETETSDEYHFRFYYHDGVTGAWMEITDLVVEDVTDYSALTGEISDIRELNVDGSTALGTLLTQLAVDGGGNSASIQQLFSAMADQTGFASAFAGVVAEVSGGDVAGFKATTWLDPDGASGSVLQLLGAIVKAGTLAVDRLTSGLGKNLLHNANFAQGMRYWRDASGPGGIYSQSTVSLRGAGNTHSGATYPTLHIYQDGTATDGYQDVSSCYHDVNGNYSRSDIPVDPGAEYLISAKLAVIDCTCSLIMMWRGADASYKGESSVIISANSADSDNPDKWTRYSHRAQAPADAAFAQFYVRKWGTSGGASTSSVLIHKPMIEEAHPEQTEPSPWSAGGTALIDGGGIFAQSVTAEQMVANTITAESGVIADAAIDTLQVAGNAITVPVFVQDNTFDTMTVVDTWVPIASVVIDRQGYHSKIQFSCQVDGNGNGQAGQAENEAAILRTRLKRGSTVIEGSFTQTTGKYGHQVSLSWSATDSDTGTGLTTYTVEATKSELGNHYLHPRTFLKHLSVQQFKR